MGTNTGIGIGIGIPFKNNALGGDRPYLPPELKARLIGVWDNYGKKNTDADRNIIKNKIPNAGGDLEILNAAYKLNSGFGEYKEDFTSWRIYPNIEVTDNVITTNGNFNSTWFIYKHANENEINEMNIKVSGIPKGGIIRYFYIPDETATIPVSYNISEDGVYHLPKSKLSSNRVSIGFTVSSSYDWNNIRIEQLSDFGGAFVTDGVNDMIISQKTLQEMGVTKDFTIVSMIHQISWRGSSSIPLTNYIRPTDNIYVRNQVADIGKTGIYGYVIYDVNNTSVNNSRIINTVLGDKNDYSIYTVGNLSQGKFSVQGYISSKGNIIETSRVAHYWTFALLGKATEDDINLIIAYFNLDRTLKPDIRCNIERQGITNDNHADFNDKLVDYSGNGRDIQMYNLAWKGGSGIAAKPFETIKDYTIVSDEARQKLTIYNEFSYKIKSNTPSYYWTVQSIIRDNTSYQVTIITDKDCYWINATSFINSEGNKESIRKKYPVLANTPTQVIICGLDQFEYPEGIEPTNAVSYVNLEYAGEITITFIPSCKGGILLDGINDFGKVIDMPIYKDYTFIIDRQIIFIGDTAGVVASKSEDSLDATKHGAFIFEYLGAPDNISTWSFYKDNGKVANTDFTRGISYQSKYSYNGKDLTVGTSKDSDKLWLGTIRDNDSRFFNEAIYSLMSFPYSMSEFLIERQLKKHKLGTLYPDMVEFRPIVKSNNKWDIIEIWQGDKSLYRPAINDDKTGIYLKKDSTIGIYVKPYVGQKVSEIVYNGVSYTNLKLNSNGFYYITVPVTKSPQKIGITIEQDENYVLFNPVINSNYDNYKLTFHLREYEKLINIGDYIPKGTYIRANLYLKNDIDELVTFTFNGVNIDYAKSPVLDTAYNIRQIYNYDSPQEVNITIDEYIKYENIDFTNCYPGVPRIYVNDKSVTWGDKLKVGDEFTFYGNVNILPKMYNVLVKALYNGEEMVYGSIGTISKSMVFTSFKTYLLDNNEPKCILSPRLLRIPNSSYKILGYIPDISGHGNHGKINNSAYAGMSGANGYPYDYKNGFMAYSNCRLVDSEIFNVISISPTVNIIKNTPTYKGKIKVTGLSGYLKLRIYPKDDSTNAIEILEDGVYDINIDNETGSVYFHVAKTKEGSNDISVIIQQVGEYEGAYCLDGVDDFVTIPTTVGGKQVLMKVNWQSIAGTAILYDQRTNGGFAIFNRDFDTNENKVPAYRARNIGGSTYIDGILNKYIYASELKNITHNIVELHDPKLNIGTLNPKIGSSYLNSNYTQMSLYDFMLFDEISTDDKIKELNTYIGITPKVTLPNYYWDNYGKKNTDANRGHVDEQVSLQKTGTSVNPLENFNISYEGMSGYNGYPVVFGASKTWENLSGVYGYTSDVTNTTIHVTHAEHAGNGLLFSYVKKDGALANIKEIPAFRVTIGGLEGNSKFGYRYLATEDATEETLVYLGNGTHELAKSFAPTEALLDLTRNVWVGIFITPMIEGEVVFDCDITIEVLPEYENGLAYDGVSDFTDNKNIPIFIDFTAIIKRVDLDAKNDNSTVMFKGDKIYESSIGNGFILDYCYNSKNYVYSYGKLNQIVRDDSKIIYLTPESYNGNPIIKGENGDNLGLVLGKYWKGIIYKTILYSKTISLLEINFLKNLMEKNEIIDINHPIFISNTEDESNTSQDT